MPSKVNFKNSIFHHKLLLRINRGFSLIEFIVVIGIIAIIASIGVFAYNKASAANRNSKRKADMKTVQNALERYFAANRRYPAGNNGYNTWGGEDAARGSASTNYIQDLVPTYISKLPNDPKVNQANPTSPEPACRNNGNASGYIYYSNGKSYKLMANCTPEGTIDPKDPFADPNRNYVFQVSSNESAKLEIFPP